MNNHNNTGKENIGESNSGSFNIGDHNTDDLNRGHDNSGMGNWGDSNTGAFNNGHENAGYYNAGTGWSGAFNIGTAPEYVFNTPISKEEFAALDLPRGLELRDVLYEHTGDTSFSYKDAWKEAWARMEESERQRYINLPHFDAEIFFEITGIRV